MGKKRRSLVQWKRSLAKAVLYRSIIILLDFATIYLFTKRTDVAVGFTVISNLYTTLIYYFHERIWAKVAWGRA